MIDVAMWLYELLVRPVGFLVLVYFVGLSLFYLALYGSAALDMRRYLREIRAESTVELLSSDLVPGVTVLVPAHNEEQSITQTVEALLTLRYPHLEIVVVDDGSTDETLRRLVDAFELERVDGLYEPRLATKRLTGLHRSGRFPNLVVATKEAGGKADALNLGLNLAETELVCAVDADTLLDPDCLRRLIRPFLRSEEVVAAGATIRVANGCTVHRGRLTSERGPRSLLPGIQVVEYLRAFLFGRPGWNRLGGNLVISGAFGLFRRNRLQDIGGYSPTVGEDMELVIRLRRDGHENDRASRVEFIPDPVAWTEAPTSLRALGRQRERWHRGFSECLWKHRKVCGNPRYGALGMVVYPAFLIFEWMAPIIELLGLVLIPLAYLAGDLSELHLIIFLSLSLGLGLLLSLLALLMEERSFRRYGTVLDRLLLVGFALVEMVGYRQLTLYWRILGIANFIRGKRSWGVMKRKGFKASSRSHSSDGPSRRESAPAPALNSTPAPALAPALRSPVVTPTR